MIASAGRDLGSPGLPYWVAAGRPVSASIAAKSRKPSAAGVDTTWTVQPRSRASLTRVSTSDAGPAPHTMTDSTPAGEVTGGRRFGAGNPRHGAGCWAGPR